MRKPLILLILLIVLGIIAYSLIKKNSGENKNIIAGYDFSYRDFAVKDIDKIKKIIIYKRNGEIVNLKKVNDDYWTLNDKYKADIVLVKNLLSAIKNVTIKYVPTDAAIENIMKGMLNYGIKVEIYGQDDKPLKKYYVGTAADNSKGTFFVMEGSPKPLVMTMPAFTGDIRVRYNYTITEWRDKSIFNENPDSIVDVRIDYPVYKDASFELRKEGGKFNLYPVYDDKKAIAGKVDQKKVKDYLLAFKNKKAEAFENDIEDKEDIIRSQPLAKIELTKADGKKKKLKIFMISGYEDMMKEEDKGINKYLNDSILRYFAYNPQTGDLFLIQYVVFEDIFKDYSYFLQ